MQKAVEKMQRTTAALENESRKCMVATALAHSVCNERSEMEKKLREELTEQLKKQREEMHEETFRLCTTVCQEMIEADAEVDTSTSPVPEFRLYSSTPDIVTIEDNTGVEQQVLRGGTREFNILNGREGN